MRDYVAYYKGKQIWFGAQSLWEAKQKAVALFKVPKSKQGLLAVVLADVPVSPAAL